MEENKSLAVLGKDFTTSIGMLSEALETDFGSEEEKEKFLDELVRHIAGEQESIVHKAANIKKFLDLVDDKIERNKGYKKEIDAANKVLENTKARLKEYVLFVLKQTEKVTGKNYIESNGIKLSYQKQGDKNPIEIKDEAFVPWSYKKYTVTLVGISKEEANALQEKYPLIKIESKPDEDAIRSALLKGETVKGSRLGEQAEGIRIKIT